MADLPEKTPSTPEQDEKGQSVAGGRELYDEIYDAENGYVLDVAQLSGDVGDVKTAHDGHTILIPQPTTDPNDPLNWSWQKKHVLLFVISAISFMSDYGSSMGAVTSIPQSIQWHQTISTIQHSTVGNLFCLGAGGLFTIALSDYFGRLPVLLVFHCISFGTSIWNATATSWPSFLASRIINGFFSIVAQAGGLLWIKDMFFFHEHPRKINLFTGGVILAPYLGPFTAAFLVQVTTWRWSFWVFAVVNGIGLLLILGLADETFYDRSVPREQQPAWNSRLKRLIGLERHGRGNFTIAVARPVIAISKIAVLLVVIYYFLAYAWIIGVNAAIATWLTEFYKFQPYQLGLFYFAPILGCLLGEVAGHWIHDINGNIYRRRYGRLDPEARLTPCYLASVLNGLSILVLGFGLQNQYSCYVLAFLYGMQVFGIMLTTTALNSYLLDAYPEGSGEVCAWINMGRCLGGFMAVYVALIWVEAAGPEKALGAQAGITWGAILIPIFLQLFGKKIRRAQGPMKLPGELSMGK